MSANPNAVNATGWQRLAAKALDVLPALAVGAAGWAVAQLLPGAGSTVPAAAAATAGAVLAGYALWLWIWEARTGKTPGNLAFGLRTTSEQGHVPGLRGIFLRNLLLALSGLLVLGPVVLLLSNRWDANHQRQGWHDKLARTLSVDVAAGRNPLETGGLRGATAGGSGHRIFRESGSRERAGAGWVPAPQAPAGSGPVGRR